MNRLIYVGIMNVIGILLALLVLAILLIIGSMAVLKVIGWAILTWFVFFVIGIVLAVIDPLKMDQ